MIKVYTIKSKSKKNVDYSVLLAFDGHKKIIPEKSSCSCKWGSFYRFNKKNVDAGKWECIHIKKAIRKYIKNEPDDIEISKRRSHEKNRKPIYPVF